VSVVELQPPAAPEARDLRPPPRFKAVTFAAYQPQDASQQRASERVKEFVEARPWRHRLAKPGSARSNWLRAPTPQRAGADKPAAAPRGLYLDGGFGVGKTHLLASAFAEADTPDKRYLGFQDLVYLIGVLGRARAERELAGCDLLCIDEFELDDPGNTLIVKSFLAAHFGAGGTVLTTSNTPPDAQGRGRFNAEDFKREIQSVASRFEVVAIGGPDYRHRGRRGDWLAADEFEALLAHERVSGDHLRLMSVELDELLASVHPSRYAGLLKQVGAVYVEGLDVIPDQNRALRFVHFIDKLYDLGLRFRATGSCELLELFHPSYRHSAFYKKHERCLSRLAELLAEGRPEPTAAVAGASAERAVDHVPSALRPPASPSTR